MEIAMSNTSKTSVEKAVSPTGGAITGGVAGGLAGAVLGGPMGSLVGATAGAIGGVLAGQRAEKDLRPDILYDDGDLEHFEQVFTRLPYYAQGMEWDDYGPAYRFAIDEYELLDDYRSLDDVETEAAKAWTQKKGDSRLTWGQARAVVEHVWTAYDEGVDPYGEIQPGGALSGQG